VNPQDGQKPPHWNRTRIIRPIRNRKFSQLGGRYPMLPVARDVAVSGDHAFVAAMGVRAFDLAACLGIIFSDGFEFGDTSAWSVVIP